MIVRKIRPEELKRTKELFAVAFEYVYDNEKDAMDVYKETFEHPKSREDVSLLDKYAAFEDDDVTMMSCLSAIHYPMQFDGNIVDMAGIGGVSSLPQYRRRGGIRGCFTQMLPELYREGIMFSCLYPFSTAYYRKFGYEMGAYCSCYEWKLDFIPAWNTDGYCVLVDASNRDAVLPDIMTVYREWQKHYNFMIQNETWEYQFITEADPYSKMEFTYLYYRADKTPVGYLTFHKEKYENTQIIVCTKLVFLDITGFKGLFTLIKSFASDHDAIRFTLPDDCEIEPFMEELSFGACERKRGHLGMVRVINVQRVLETAKYIGSGRILIEIHDEYISENNGVFDVIFENNKAISVKKVHDLIPQVTMPINEFSRLITGVLRAESIAFCENVKLGKNETEIQPVLGQVFYKKPCFLMEYF